MTDSDRATRPVPVFRPVPAQRPAPPPDDDGPLLAGPGLADIGELRAGWQRIKAGFVDDPRASAAEAAQAIEEATGMLIAALRMRQQRIRDSWDSDDPSRGDTEDLRLAVLRYQSLFNRITEER